MFLTDKELATLTGIRMGRNGKSREQLQCEHLRKVGIPFYPDARGRPVVVAEALTGRQIEQVKPRWEPRPIQG